jgi:hypothetical protein
MKSFPAFALSLSKASGRFDKFRADRYWRVEVLHATR